MTYADLLLHVVDVSYSDHDFHIGVTNSVLKEIGAGEKDKLMIYNKIDVAEEMSLPHNGEEIIYISATRGDNMDILIQRIKGKLFSDRIMSPCSYPTTGATFHPTSATNAG